MPAATIAAARESLPGFRALCAGATDAQRRVILKGLSEFVGKPDVLRFGTLAEQQQYWATFDRNLSHVPAAVLQRTCDDYLQRAAEPKFMPDPGVLLSLAKHDYAWRDDLDALKGLQRISLAKPDGPRSYIGSEAVERELSERLAGAIKRIDAAEKAGAEADARPYDPTRWDDAGRKSLLDTERRSVDA